MRLAPLLLAATAALALAAPAAAKELSKAEVCGPAGCTAVTDRETLNAIPLGGDEPPSTQPQLQPFHTVRLTVTEGEGGPEHSWTVYYVDRAGMMAWKNEGGTIVWSQLNGPAATAMRRLVRGVEAFPAPRISATLVDGRAVSADPASYLALFQEPGRRMNANVFPHDWVPIDFRSAKASPWTDAPFELMYSPSTNAIERGIQQVVLPDALASDIEATRPLAAGEATRWLPWLVVGALMAALLVLAGLGAVLRRRFEPAAPEPAA
jgi:hypothetical protein